MVSSKHSVTLLFVLAFGTWNAVCEKTLSEPCPKAFEETPENCEWIIENTATARARCPVPVLMCRGENTTSTGTLAHPTDRPRTLTSHNTMSPGAAASSTHGSALLDQSLCGAVGCEEGYVCMKDKSRVALVHAGFNEAKCVKATLTGAGLCPMPFVHPASGACSPNCRTDDDCSKGQMCCDIGCGLRCSRLIPPCENKALPLPLPPNCHIEETQGPLGHACRNFTLYCLDSEKRTAIVKPMPTLDEIQNNSSSNTAACFSNSDCPHGQTCTQGKEKTAECARVNTSRSALCPAITRVKHIFKCDGRDCETDEDCSHAQMCCDVGCRSAKCVQSVKVCDGQLPNGTHSPHPACYYKILPGRYPHRHDNCVTFQEFCPNQTSAELEQSKLYLDRRNQSQKALGLFCDDKACPQHLTCIEMVKRHTENGTATGTKVRRAVCLRTNRNRTSLCPAPDFDDKKEEACTSDCASDGDCATGESCCDMGCGLRCSRMKLVCNGHALRKYMPGRTCYHEETMAEEEGPCRSVRLFCKRPPWRSQHAPLASAQQRRRLNRDRANLSNALTQLAATPIPRSDKCIEKGCPKNDRQPSVCIEDKVTGQTQCVRIDAVGAGVCPIVPITKSCPLELGKAECVADDQCPTGQLCCPVACGLAKCITPKPACDAKPIRNMSPNCYFERLRNDGQVACHNLHSICYDEFDPTGARSGSISSYNGPAPLGAEEELSGVRSRFRKP